ncbi:MAG: tetratricopeptide repeat protein [Alphaproteobacteria bacterium]
MSASEMPPMGRVWHTAKEYMTHWVVAGVIVTITGFTPDHWVANLFHAVNLDSLRDALPSADYRLIAVGVGVAVVTGDFLLRSRKRHKAQAAPATGIAAIESIEDRLSIAVLPFNNMSDDATQEYFADGITEDIITGLSSDSRLFVVARNSTFAYKGQSPDIRTVGKELGVRYVLEGSIRQISDRIRINVQLIETSSGTHVWADKIDRPVAEFFDIMDEVVNGLVVALCSNLGVAEAKRAARQRPEDLQAWALCMQAAATFSLQSGMDAPRDAEKLLRRAAEIEPGYGVSWALLALIASFRDMNWLPPDGVTAENEGIALANKAMVLAPHDPLVLGYCGSAYAWAGQSSRGIDCLERSLELNPNSGLFRLYYGAALWTGGRAAEGVAQLELFFRLSPKDPHAGLANFYSANCYLSLGDYQKAEESGRKAIKLRPGFTGGYFQLAIILMGQERIAEARHEMQKVRQMAPHWTSETAENFLNLSLRNTERAGELSTLMREAWAETAGG